MFDMVMGSRHADSLGNVPDIDFSQLQIIYECIDRSNTRVHGILDLNITTHFTPCYHCSQTDIQNAIYNAWKITQIPLQDRHCPYYFPSVF